MADYTELNQAEEEASKQISAIESQQAEQRKYITKVPERKYGSKISKNVQQQYVQRNVTATQNIQQLEKQKQQYVEYKGKVQQQKADIAAKEAHDYRIQRALYDSDYLLALSPSEKAEVVELYKQGYGQGLYTSFTPRYNPNDIIKLPTQPVPTKNFLPIPDNPFVPGVSKQPAPTKSFLPPAYNPILDVTKSMPKVEAPKLDIPSLKLDYVTATDISKMYNEPTPVQLQPYITRNKISSFEDKETGRQIPVYSLTYVDPTVMGKQFERVANKEEEQEFFAATNVLQAKTKSKSKPVREVREVLGLLQKDIRAVNYSDVQKLSDANIEAASRDIAKALKFTIPPLLAVESISRGKVKTEPAVAAFLSGIAKDLRDRPLQNVATFGAGAAFGFTARGVPLVAAKVPAAYGWVRTGKVLGTGTRWVIKGGSLTLAGLYGVEKAKTLTIAGINKDTKAIWEEVGRTSLEVAEFGAGLKLGVKPYNVKTKLKVKEPEFNVGKDTIKQLITPEGDLIQVGKYKITARVPKAELYTDRPIKAFLRDYGFDNRFTKPTLVKTYKPYVFSATGTVIMRNGNIVYGQVVSGRKGFTTRYVDNLYARQEPFNPKQWEKLTNVEKYIIKKGFRGFLPESEKIGYYKGELNVVKKFRVSIGRNKANFRFPQQGKTTTRLATISEIKEIKDVEGLYSDYYTKLALKDITFPNAKAAGKVPDIVGKSRVYEPTYIDVSGDIVKVKTFPTKTSKYIPTGDEILKGTYKPPQTQIPKVDSILKQAAVAEVTAAKGAGLKDISTRITKLTKGRAIGGLAQTGSLREIPTYVGGLGLGTSAFAAKGVSGYEAVEPMSLSINKTVPKEINKEVTKEITKDISKEISKNINKEITKEITKEIVKPVQKEITKVVLKPIQKVVLKTPVPKSPFINIPRIPQRKTPPGAFGFRRKRSRGLFDLVGFKTFIIRRGKEVSLPGIREKGSALRYGQSVAQKTLAATFFVRPTKETIRAKQTAFVPNLSLFRGYKIKKGKRITLNDRYIQRKGKRLANVAEVKELLGYSRKRRKKK